MKLNKTFGRIATTLVATAMLASVAVVPAFAEEPTESNMTNGAVNNDNNSALTEIVFQKDLVIPSGVATPNVTFTFDLTGATAGENETATDTTTTVKVLDGTGHGALSDVSVTFDSNSEVTDAAESNDKTQTVTEYVKLDLTQGGFTFDAPGIYKYTLTEDDLGDVNYTESAPYTVYLYVERLENDGEDSFVVTGATMFSGTNEENSKTNVVTNYYLTTPEGDVTPNSLTVDKTVSGDMGDKGEKFEFEITITAKKINDQNDSSRNYTATNAIVENNQDGTYTVTGSLKHDESLTINGLVAGDSYVVNEKAYDQDGYTSSTNPTGLEGVTTFENNKTRVTFNAATADSIAYTNTREAVSPTGLVMDIAPYALLVVVAAAGCFVFLRKRRED